VDTYKFELIRADKSQQITHCVSNKFKASTADQLLECFLDFTAGCGFQKNLLYDAMRARIDKELSE
jgi:hypothetical protein